MRLNVTLFDCCNAPRGTLLQLDEHVPFALDRTCIAGSAAEKSPCKSSVRGGSVWRVQTHPPICILEKRLVMLPLLLLAAPAAWLMTEEELTVDMCACANDFAFEREGRGGGGRGTDVRAR